jgi:hypothetical protein
VVVVVLGEVVVSGTVGDGAARVLGGVEGGGVVDEAGDPVELGIADVGGRSGSNRTK